MKHLLSLLCVACLSGLQGNSQPTIPVCAPSEAIRTFPHLQNFENNNHGWFNHSSLFTWVWGTPAKNLINTAGSGTKCWMLGSLSSSFYSNEVSAVLVSPCYDLSALQDPRVRFKVFWDTEKNEDGVVVFYSVNNSNPLRRLGSINSNVPCIGTNWFNSTFPIWDDNNPQPTPLRQDGWTGNTTPAGTDCPPAQGGGSGKWVTASHTLNIPGLVGQSIVRFFFFFYAGPDCNRFDGFALDDFVIEETPTQLSINRECINNFELKFFTDGPCLLSYSWNFGDPASGPDNSSAQDRPTHRFSAPGTYTVTVSGNNAQSQPMQASTTVTVIDMSSSVDWPGFCTGQPTGTITLNPTGSNAGYSYQWNTSPPQTGATLSNIGTGFYIATVTAPNACAITDSFDLRNNIATVALGPDADICPGQSLTLNAGNFASYLWQDGSIGSQFIVRAAGQYHVTVRNAAGCTASDTVNITMDCRNVYFPTAFTPNGDGNNDAFGPAGNLMSLQQYSLTIFDRYGQKIFFSNDPFEKWNGTNKGSRYNMGGFIWHSEFMLNNRREKRKGTVLLIR
jgi:gliding motility-associated-like protein